MNFKVISFHWFGNDKMTKQSDFLKFSFDETPSTLLQVLKILHFTRFTSSKN